MDAPILVSKILGIYLALAGLFLIVRGKTIPYLLKDFFNHPAMLYLTGVILVFLSSLYLLEYNIWDGTWKTVITVFVWLVLLKGVAYIFFPQVLNEVVVKKFRGMFGAYGVVAIFIGVYLVLLG